MHSFHSTCGGPRWSRLAWLFVMAGVAWIVPCVGAVSITRGPYLQNATPVSITIRWRTEVASPSVVFYGTEPEFLYQVTGNIQPVTEHEVVVDGLSPSTLYYYSVGSLVESLAGGPDYHFTTLPPEGVSTPTRIWAMGDCGTLGLVGFGRPRQLQVRDAFLAYTAGHPADMWLALGDNAYLSGTDAEYQSQFFNVYSNQLRNLPLWSTVGNHELYSNPKDGVFPYFKIFSPPMQ
ncbi:MAG TPA: metallophosphoesterase family protein, partial [Myxococcota bacterium]|nr:metallophosphoesterase family protein [Myxococcota bacterium]